MGSINKELSYVSFINRAKATVYNRSKQQGSSSKATLAHIKLYTLAFGQQHNQYSNMNYPE